MKKINLRSNNKIIMILPMIEYNLYLVLIQNVFNNSKMKDDKIKDLQFDFF